MATSVNNAGGDKVFQGQVREEFSEVDEVHKLIDSLKDVYKDNIATELVVERFTFIVDHYQEQPHLMDPHLQEMLTHLLKIASDTQGDPELSHLAFKLLYLLTKARGYKVIVRFLPHEVPDLELVLAILAKQDVKDFKTWETRYMLLLWLSIVCMIPFDMHRLDSNVVAEDGQKRAPIMLRILDAGKLYLDVSDKSRDAAAYMLSKFVTRPDVRKEQLPVFIDWCLTILTKTDSRSIPGMTAISGILSSLALLLKHGKRDDLIPFAPAILERLNSCKLFESFNNAIRKMAMKVVQRLGLTFMKAKVASWRYARGSRSLLHNLQTPSEQASSIVASSKDIKVEEEEDYDIPEEIEEIIEHLLSGLKDFNTAVRWSAAKGIGRLTGRLPQELADEVVESVLQLFTLRESDGAWQGGCLSLAELGRRGLLLPSRLPDVVPVVLKALAYDEKRGAHSVGTHVRDAACYVCWSFARAYDPNDIQPYVNSIASALIVTAIFDREVNCRYAASAAFQENVGRQGTFPHGIDILSIADYYAVGNRTNTYLSISYTIAQFEEYTIPLIEHLYKVKSNHWDSNIRELTGQALHKLTPLAPEYMAKTVIPYLLPLTTSIDLNTRHGAVYALAEVLHAVYEHTKANSRKLVDLVDVSVFESIKGITKKMDAAMMFRGISGEFMRPAACFLIRKSSMSQLPFHDDSEFLKHWHEVLEDNIQCLQIWNRQIQVAAVSALPHFLNEYFKTAKQEFIDTLLDRYISELSNVSQFAKEGFAMALGALPHFIVDGHFQQILLALIKTTKLSGKQQDDGKYADSRIEALASIARLCSTVGVNPSGSTANSVCLENVDLIYNTFLEAMKDYTTDNRGDIGALVRESSMNSLEKVTCQIVRSHPAMFSPPNCEKMMCCLVQQSCEKIDRIRKVAGQIFLRLVYSEEPSIPDIPHHQEIMEVFPKSDVNELNWAAPSDAFPKVTRLLNLPKYRYSIILGLTVSVGGLTESLVKYSSQSLTGFLTSLKNEEDLSTFSDTMLAVFKDYQKVDRVSVPMLKMIDILLTHGCFNGMEGKQNSFSLALLEVCKKEILKTKDIQKMLCSVDVFCDLLLFKGETQSKAFSQILIFLGHKYPMIRKSTANKLYETLLMFDDLTPEENQEEILTILGDTMCIETPECQIMK
ncbi:tubulin-specific chaperone D-like isoform X2 [Anneissia japonica]|uniref:tubulin-specific chaperone D-like isoform X2 n=1 Tax=Anneissia japonica TaxID=1529436 RepID=UPI00142562E9|nr:tubulin-specific chaperone D-like isoform X2 [Anneissia japonica]